MIMQDGWLWASDGARDIFLFVPLSTETCCYGLLLEAEGFFFWARNFQFSMKSMAGPGDRSEIFIMAIRSNVIRYCKYFVLDIRFDKGACSIFLFFFFLSLWESLLSTWNYKFPAAVVSSYDSRHE